MTAAGEFGWIYGNMGQDDMPGGPGFTVLVPGQTYHMQGWTINGSTTFTNDATGHGMTVTLGDAITGSNFRKANITTF